MKKAFCIFFILISGSLLAQHEAYIDSAKNAYAAGEFEKAAQYYETILESGYESAELYYNLGNAYYKSNKLTDAIINYERALMLEPADEDIQFNLEVARNYVVDKIEVLPRLFIYDWIDALINLFSSDAWAKISMFSFIVLLVFFLFYFFTNKVFVKKLSFWFGVFLIVISVLSFWFSAKQKQMLQQKDTAIIYSSSVTLKSSPDESGNDLFVLHEGTKVYLEDSVQNWIEIRIADGNKGWLQAEDIVIL